MKCPECGGATGVRDSRVATRGWWRRRRYCKVCGHTFSTVEVPAQHVRSGPNEHVAPLMPDSSCGRADCQENATTVAVLRRLVQA